MTSRACMRLSHPPSRRWAAAIACTIGGWCGGSALAQERAVTIVPSHANVVAYWNAVANKTVATPSAVNSTAEELRPAYQDDLATVHVAIYDAVNAIEGRFQPFAIAPLSSAQGASADAAASAAAYGVLRALFPDRGAQFQAAYDERIAMLPEGEARSKGLALGSEVAAAVVALRANDGRSVALAPYVSGTLPGQFRSAGPMPFNRHVPFIKPFSLGRIDQFRPPAPPALDSAAYAVAFDESRSGGGTVSTVRSAEQLEMARFHSEPPGAFVTRNLGRFASSTDDVVEAARLMAFIYVAHADAIGACFEAKYFYGAWRPASAIPLADGDGNDATVGDSGWTPVLPTPNHPEYPAAHSCTAGALGETLRLFYGTRQVRYAFDSMVTHTTRTYETSDALTDESRVARVYGGMHFGFSSAAGAELGARVARWVGAHHFGRLP